MKTIFLDVIMQKKMLGGDLWLLHSQWSSMKCHKKTNQESPERCLNCWHSPSSSKTPLTSWLLAFSFSEVIHCSFSKIAINLFPHKGLLDGSIMVTTFIVHTRSKQAVFLQPTLRGQSGTDQSRDGPDAPWSDQVCPAETVTAPHKVFLPAGCPLKSFFNKEHTLLIS